MDKLCAGAPATVSYLSLVPLGTLGCLPVAAWRGRSVLLLPGRLAALSGPVARAQAQDERHGVDLSALLLCFLVFLVQAGDLSHHILLQVADLLQQRIFVAALLPPLLPQQLP